MCSTCANFGFFAVWFVWRDREVVGKLACGLDKSVKGATAHVTGCHKWLLTSFCHCSFCLCALCSKLVSIRICSCQHDSLPVCSSAHFLFHLPAPMSLLFWSPFCIPLFHPPFVLPPHKRGTLISASAQACVEKPRRPFPGVRFSLFFSFN